MKYKLTIEAEFEADSYVKALGSVASVVQTLDDNANVNITKTDFSGQPDSKVGFYA